jgi:hypothetical protein
MPSDPSLSRSSRRRRKELYFFFPAKKKMKKREEPGQIHVIAMQVTADGVCIEREYNMPNPRKMTDEERRERIAEIDQYLGIVEKIDALPPPEADGTRAVPVYDADNDAIHLVPYQVCRVSAAGKFRKE